MVLGGGTSERQSTTVGPVLLDRRCRGGQGEIKGTGGPNSRTMEPAPVSASLQDDNALRHCREVSGGTGDTLLLHRCLDRGGTWSCGLQRSQQGWTSAPFSLSPRAPVSAHPELGGQQGGAVQSCRLVPSKVPGPAFQAFRS